MWRITLLLTLLIPEFIVSTGFAEEIQVLLMLKKSEQVDSSGCNFVEQVTAKVYDEIINDRVKLWDSQKKEIRISGTTLREIEKASGTSFTALETIFMYEMWENNKKEITTRTLGFSFVNRSNSSEEVAFGYVDYNDLKELFQKTRINTNASGNYSATFTTYVLNKNFVFNIVQFAGKTVKTATESEDLKKNFIRNLKFNESLTGYYPPDKYINYIVDTYTEGTDVKTVNTKNLIRKLEDYFSRNQEVFLNLGGDRIATHFQKNKIKVTRIEVNEIWKKTGDEIFYDPKSVVIYVNDSALNEINSKNVTDLYLAVNDMDLFSFLKSKSFNFIITKINSQEIRRKDAFLYYKALMNAPWSQVIQYVVNY